MAGSLQVFKDALIAKKAADEAAAVEADAKIRRGQRVDDLPRLVGRCIVEDQRFGPVQRAEQLGQRFIVVNKAAASGVVGSAAVAHAKPDGYTLLHGAAFSLTVQPLTDKQTGYTHKSFEPICQTFKNDQVIVVRPDSPLKSAGDLIAAAKAKPGGLNYGHPGIATIPHLAMIEFGAFLKLLLYISLIACVFLPWKIALFGTGPLSYVVGAGAYIVKLAVAGFLLALFETATAKMRVFRVPQFLGAALMLGLLGTLLLFVSRSF